MEIDPQILLDLRTQVEEAISSEGFEWEMQHNWSEVVCRSVIEHNLSPRMARAILKAAGILSDMGLVNIVVKEMISMINTMLYLSEPKLFVEPGYAERVCKRNNKPGDFNKAVVCRYLATGMNGLRCTKLVPELRAKIDAISDSFAAKGDNCPGMRMISEEIHNMN